MAEEVKENSGGNATATASKGGGKAGAGKSGLKMALGVVALGTIAGAVLTLWPSSESKVNAPEPRTNISGAGFNAKGVAPSTDVDPRYKDLLSIDQKKRLNESEKKGESAIMVSPVEGINDIAEETLKRLTNLEFTVNKLKDENDLLRRQLKEQALMRRSGDNDAPNIDFYVLDDQAYASKKVFNARIKRSEQLVQSILKGNIFPEADVVSVAIKKKDGDRLGAQYASIDQYGSYNTAYVDNGYGGNGSAQDQGVQGRSNTVNTKNEKEGQSGEVVIRAGEMIYATLDMTANSDVPGPVMATLQTGELAGAKVLGRFAKKNDYLVLEFNSMTLPDGRFVNISGIAVDPMLRTVAMADEIDRHIPSKLLAIFGAAWIQGIGEAYLKKGSLNTVGGTAGSAVVEQSALDTPGDIAIAGLSKVGEALANMITPYANRPDTIIKYANSGLAVLFTKPVVVK